MARLTLSPGMLAALASNTALRRRGFLSGSPPPMRAAMMISRIIRVKILPRLASSAPFLCLIVAHFEWPDIGTSLRYKNLADARRGRRESQTSNYSTDLRLEGGPEKR